MIGITSPSLTMSATVKHFSSRQLHTLEEERHFALVGLRFPTLGSLLIVRVRNSVRPSLSSISYCDHDYLFRLPGDGERDAQSLRR